MGNFKLYTPEDALRDFVALRAEELKRFVGVRNNIARFLEEAKSSFDVIAKRLDRIKSLPAKSGAIVVDPTKRILSLLQVESFVLEEVGVLTVLVSMKPPVLPHFFLAVAYLTVRGGLTPVTLVRLSPILTLVSALGDVGDVTAAVANFVISSKLVEMFATHEVAVLPFPEGVTKLPMKTKKEGILYLTGMGLATVPLEGTYNVEVDLSEIPPIGEKALGSPEFKSLKEVLDGLVARGE